ncbi:MAG: polysaccharide biosynthesis tyrosine autokinase [Crocinitomicaceae bacterium]|nr:polysaccharide biosynthesis tyrosine autokinase [Crocinitomicaceae bacterium]
MIESNKPIKRNSLNRDLDLNLAVTVLKRNFYVPLIFLFIGLGASFVYLRYTKPVFQSTAVIQRSSQDEGKRILDIEGFEKENDLSEDVELLHSTFLLEKALRNLNLEISYYAEGDILTEERYLLSSYHVTLMELKDSSLVGVPIFITNTGSAVDLTFEKQGVSQTISIQPNTPVNNEYFNMVFKVNNEAQFNHNSRVNKLYFVFNDYEILTTQLMPRLDVFTLNPDARTIQISFKSNNQRLSRDVVSSLINTFFEYDLDKKRQSSANILDFINSQLDTVFVQLKESEHAIQSFKDSSSVNDPEYFTKSVMDRSNELQNQLIEVDFELELIEEVSNKVELNDRMEIYKVIPAVTGTAYEDLLVGELKELHEILVEKEDLSYKIQPEHPDLKKAESRVDKQVKNILRILNTIRSQLNFKRKSLEKRIYKVESELYGVPAKEMELSRLNRMFNLNEKYYTLLIEKKTQYSISKAGFTMDNMVLQAPTLAVMISPNKKFVYALAIILTFIVSLIFLLIRYITFNDIYEPEELKRLLPSKVGFLGIIPKVVTDEKMSTLIVHLQPKSALAESYRHIRSNLQFILKNNESNVIAVSSSVSGEGKTFAAVNLGGIIAMSGKKVLVIDLDLRKPKVHHAFKAENHEGMSSILIGSAKWKDCIQNSELEGLDFITAGPIPPNPSELIISGEMEKYIEKFKEEYDIVMIDNPPVGIVSDGITILNNADCPIYVFRANYSKRFYTQRVRELLNNEQVKKLFVVLNGIELSKKGYGYGYGYGYGDYYTEEKKTKKVWQFWRKS